MPIPQETMTEPRVVAIWLGSQTDELDFEDYLESQFTQEFGFIINPASGPEMDARPSPIPVADLLNGFSMDKHWLSAALQRCADLNIASASSALAFHFLRYDPNLCEIASNAGMQFIGNFDWPAND